MRDMPSVGQAFQRSSTSTRTCLQSSSRRTEIVSVRIMRPGVKPINDHPSETALDSHHFDGYVMNDSNLVDLEGEVQRVLGDLG